MTGGKSKRFALEHLVEFAHAFHAPDVMDATKVLGDAAGVGL